MVRFAMDRQQEIECEKRGSKICMSGRAESPEEGTGGTGLGESQSLRFVPGYLLPHSKPLLSSHAFLFGVWKAWLQMAKVKRALRVVSPRERLAAVLPAIIHSLNE